MKKLCIIALGFLQLIAACKKDKSSTPSGTPVTASGMTAWETSLVGQWKLKRTEVRSNSYLPGLGDSTFTYTNHYNYLYSQLELGTTPVAGTSQYAGVMGMDDVGTASAITWCGGSANTITIGSNLDFFIVHYLSTDSLVLDAIGGIGRYFYNKTTTPPSLNVVENQLPGGMWQLLTINGSAPGFPTYRTFFSNWYSDDGYFLKDSVATGGSGLVTAGEWEVLFPTRAIPILKTGSGSWYKITNLTSTALTLEQLANPTVNSSSGIIYVYSR